MWVHTKESQDKITPADALELLKEGNKRFRNNLKMDRHLLTQVNLSSEGQYPFATVLSCIDSRTSAELIFDQGLGDIFSIRIAGNVINDDILGSMEYACDVVKSKIIMVLGHTKCGAITSACDQVESGHLAGLLRKIQPAINQESVTRTDRNGRNYSFVKNVSTIHVRLMINQIRAESPILSRLEKEGSIRIEGGLYDIDSGEVTFFDD
ncbi:MAG: carbonic anhydrase [Porphyromonadaceae bacterium]|nr:carbonic anhydrase [Porphyromonadaceae bacterium]